MKNKKVFIGIAIAVLMITSFLAGSFVAEEKNKNNRKESCTMLVMCAIDRIEKNEFETPEGMKQLISDVYAACLYCDDAEAESELRVVWQYLVFKEDNFDDRAQYILSKLNDVIAA